VFKIYNSADIFYYALWIIIGVYTVLFVI